VRKVLSIGFVFVILFNTVGYLYVLDWEQHEIVRKAEELIDNHASQISGNLIFRIPVTTNYLSETSREYTRVEGEIEFEGIAYRMVKQKVEGNFHYIVCVRDEHTKVATREINDMIATIAGQPAKQSMPFGLNFAKVLLEYCSVTSTSSHLNSEGWSRDFSFSNHENSYRFEGEDSLFHPPAVC
jgi:hypothetical protein